MGGRKEAESTPHSRQPSHLEVRDLVAFAQCDLEYVHGADESREPGQTLLAAPTYTNQQSISPWGLQDAIDTAATEGEAEACCFDQILHSAKRMLYDGLRGNRNLPRKHIG